MREFANERGENYNCEGVARYQDRDGQFEQCNRGVWMTGDMSRKVDRPLGDMLPGKGPHHIKGISDDSASTVTWGDSEESLEGVDNEEDLLEQFRRV